MNYYFRQTGIVEKIETEYPCFLELGGAFIGFPRGKIVKPIFVALLNHQNVLFSNVDDIKRDRLPDTRILYTGKCPVHNILSYVSDTPGYVVLRKLDIISKSPLDWLVSFMVIEHHCIEAQLRNLFLDEFMSEYLI